MAKARKKPIKKKKRTKKIVLSQDRLRHMRLVQGGLGVIQELAPYSTDDIIIGSYVHTNHEKAQKLAWMYDRLLLEAKADPDIYLEKRADMMAEITEYIHENRLYREWMDLVLIVNENIQTEKILHAYMNEMMDTWRDLAYQTPGKLVCGLSSSGELLYVPDRFGDWDLPILETHMKLDAGLITKDDMAKFVKENVHLDIIAKNENLWSIELFDMMPFINERTVKILADEPMKNYATPLWDLPFRWLPTDVYKEAIRKRKYMIGRKGVRVEFLNGKDVEELFIMEDIDRNNELVMLYQVTIKDLGAFTGYYRAKQQHFFSVFLRTFHQPLHEDLENFVLGIYADLVGELDKNRRRMYRIEEVESFEHMKSYMATRIYYRFISSEKQSGKKSGKKSGQHPSFQKPHFRSFALRKLPENWEASEEAKKRAEEYGIELQEGYTFVRPYAVGRDLLDMDE